MLKLETNLKRFDEPALQDMVAALPPSWQERILCKKTVDARLRSTVAYTLLRDILNESYNITALPPIISDTDGKPHLVGVPLYFSISHCKAAVACIVEENPIGIDVQDLLTDISAKLRARIAVPFDPDTLDSAALTALWTQKEASAKLDGRGLAIGLKALPFTEHRLETIHYSKFVLTIARPA